MPFIHVLLQVTSTLPSSRACAFLLVYQQPVLTSVIPLIYDII